MNLNEDFIIKNYKTIHKTCLMDGYLLPTILSPARIPFEYRLTYQELQNIDINETELKRRLADRREIEQNVMEGTCDVFSTIPDYWEYEITKFIQKYPQFNNIIQQ